MGVIKGKGNARLIGQERLLLEDLRQEWRNAGRREDGSKGNAQEM